jgi:3-oxoacyl-[acyl-carrier protein] reductase
VNIAVAQLWRSYGPIHLLVNCAGVAYQSKFLQSKLPQVQEELSLNLLAMYNLTSLIARRMASQKTGTIVNVSSLMGKVAAPTMATYSATKFAILGFTQALRRELAEHNIRVVALLPTLTDTDMIRGLQLFRWVVPMTPQQVGQVFVNGLKRNQTEIVVGWQSHLTIWCQRLFPELLEAIVNLATPTTGVRTFGGATEPSVELSQESEFGMRESEVVFTNNSLSIKPEVREFQILSQHPVGS